MRHVFHSFTLLLLVCCLHYGWTGAEPPYTVSSTAAKVRSRLFNGTNYDASVRPTKDNGTATSISFSFMPSGSVATHEDLHDGHLDITMYFNLVWQDDGLTWDKLSERTILILNPQEIWTPGVTPMNALQYTSDERAMVTSDGMVLWYSVIHARVPCGMDMTQYPYDEHNCTITFAALSYPHEDIKFEVKETSWAPRFQFTKWLPVSTWTSIGQILNSSSVQVVIRLRRINAASYRYTVVIPTTAVSLTTLLVPWLPVTSSRRVTLACFNLITARWLLYEVTWLFESSVSVPKIVIYLSLATATNAAVLVWSILASSIAATSMPCPRVLEIVERFLQRPFAANVFCLISSSAGSEAMASRDNPEGEAGAEAQQLTTAESEWKEDDRLMVAKALDRFAFYIFFFVLVGTLTWSCI